MQKQVRLLIATFVGANIFTSTAMVMADNPPGKTSTPTVTSTTKATATKTGVKSTTPKSDTKPASTKSDIKPAAAKADTKSAATKPDTKSAATKPDTKSTATKPDTKSTATKLDTKSAGKKPDVKPTVTNLSGTWNIKFTESPTTKTHIMAVKVVQKGTALSATGVDQYGDVILTGTVTQPDKVSFKRTYKADVQPNPAAQFDGTFTPGKEFTPAMATGKWTAQPFADKNQKAKASSNTGDWNANIFTGPAINK